MSEQNEHYRKVAERLRKLRPTLANLGEAELLELYDELLDENEFGCALDVLCDSLIDTADVSLSDDEFYEIAALHELMKMDATRLSEFKRDSSKRK